MYFYDVCYLDDWVTVRGRELASLSCTLDIKTQNSQRRNLRVLAITRQALHVVVIVDIKLDLASGFLPVSGANFPIFLFNLNPGHSPNLIVNHESQRIQHIGLISGFRQLNYTLSTFITEAPLYLGSQCGDVLRMLNVNFEEYLGFVLVKHYRHSFTHFNLHDCLL